MNEYEDLLHGVDWLRKEAKENGPSDPLPTSWVCPLHKSNATVVRRHFSDLGDKSGPIYVMVELNCGCDVREKDTHE